MTNITLVRNKLKDPTVDKLKTILKPVFSSDCDQLSLSDIITLLNQQTDPNMVYKLSVLYIKHYEKTHLNKTKGTI